MANSEASLVCNFFSRCVNRTRQMLVSQKLWKDLCATVGATLLVPCLRHHLKGHSAETAGLSPQEEEGRQSKDI